MKRNVKAHIIASIIVSIIGFLDCYLFEDLSLLNVLKSMAEKLIYYWIIIGSASLLRKAIEHVNET